MTIAEIKKMISHLLNPACLIPKSIYDAICQELDKLARQEEANCTKKNNERTK